MLAVSIDLGSIKVAGKTPHLTLTLSASVTIGLPPSWPEEASSAEELCLASSTGKIWISKAGSCRIDIASLVNHEVPDAESVDPNLMAAITGFLPECRVWEYIGLDLRANHASHDGLNHGTGQASYFLHHPDLSSELIAPPDIPCAQFQGLRCEANYNFRSPKSKEHRMEQPASGSLDMVQHEEETTPRHTYGLRRNPKRSRKAAVAQDETNSVGYNLSENPRPRSEPIDDKHEREDMESLVAEALVEMACLLDFALRKLIGVKGVFPGIRTLRSARSPTLIDTAPAVWDLQYLQMMSIHSQAIPGLATGIARLRNAHSTSLREKLGIMNSQRIRGNSSQESGEQEADDTTEVKSRLWLLCQTRIRPEPIKGHQIKKVSEKTADQLPSQLIQPGQDVRALPYHYHGFNVDPLIAAGVHDTTADDGACVAFPEALGEPNLFGVDSILLTGAESDPWTDGDLSADEWMHSSEGDYFYADGQGNVYPVERQDSPEDDPADWSPTPQLLGSEEFSLEEEEEEAEVPWDEDANETYIMYHEVQHWSAPPGVHIHAVDGFDQLPPLPPPSHDDWED